VKVSNGKFRPVIEAMVGELVREFTDGLLGVIRNMSIDDILLESGGAVARRVPVAGKSSVASASKPRRLGRRSPRDIGVVVNRIAALLKRHPKGLRAEEIREELGVQPKELPRPLAEGLKSGAFKKSGQKRATVYFPGGSKAPKASKVKASKAKAVKVPKASKVKASKPRPKAKSSSKAKASKAKASKPKAKAKASKPKAKSFPKAKASKSKVKLVESSGQRKTEPEMAHKGGKVAHAGLNGAAA
jgi:hypothetical protein